MFVNITVCQQHFRRAVELRRRVRHGLRALAGHQDMHVAAERLGCGHRLGGRVLEMSVVVFRDQKGGHCNTPASFFSFSTSSATEPTFTPDLRPPGSTVFSTSSRGLTSTP